jgi:tetratricopeptide (TPR) repeat protein
LEPMLIRTSVLSLLALCIHGSLYAQAVRIFDIMPGVTTKAETDLILGEPLQRLKPDSLLFQYSPPPNSADADKVVVSFFSDTKQVSRLDVYLKSPLPPEALRNELGRRVIQRDREDGKPEEIYYPKLMALILGGKGSADPAIATCYLSSRYIADIYINRCFAKIRNNEFADAQDEASKAVLVNPDYARGYFAQGRVFHAQENYDEAIVRFTAAVNTREGVYSRSEAHAWLGYTYWKQKSLPVRAEEEYKKGIAAAPQYYLAHLEFGRFLRGQKQLDRASAELSKAVELNPSNADARLDAAAIASERKDFAGAIPHYEWLSLWMDTSAAADRNDAFKTRILFDCAYALASTGQHEKAIQAYEKVLKKSPGYALALNNLGYSYQILGNTSKAEELYRAGLKLDPSHFALNQNLARLLLSLSRHEEARIQIERTLALKPKDSFTMMIAAQCWAAAGKKKQALDWIEKAAAAGYRDADFLARDSNFKSLQSNDNFQKLLAKMRQPQ